MYIYPDNLKSKAVLWLWELRDIAIIGVGALAAGAAIGAAVQHDRDKDRYRNDWNHHHPPPPPPRPYHRPHRPR